MDLVTFTEEILNGKPHFLCSASSSIVFMKPTIKHGRNINKTATSSETFWEYQKCYRIIPQYKIPSPVSSLNQASFMKKSLIKNFRKTLNLSENLAATFSFLKIYERRRTYLSHHILSYYLSYFLSDLIIQKSKRLLSQHKFQYK